MFPSKAEYEQFIYDLPAQVEGVKGCDLVLYSIRPTIAVVQGHVLLDNGIEIRVREVIDFSVGRLMTYSYVLFHRGNESGGWIRSPILTSRSFERPSRTTGICRPTCGTIVCQPPDCRSTIQTFRRSSVTRGPGAKAIADLRGSVAPGS